MNDCPELGGRPQYYSRTLLWGVGGCGTWSAGSEGMVLAHCWGSEGSHDSSPRGLGLGGASFAEAAPVGVVGVLVGVVFGC